MKQIKTYSDLMLYIDEHWEDTEWLLDYDDFSVVKIKKDGQEICYYYEKNINDCSEFYEVEPVAVLTYDMMHDLQIKEGETLKNLFICDCCGEWVGNENIKYLWFKRVRG